jgi:hypothetical protein
MTSTTLHTAGLVLVTVPTIELGGFALLRHLTRRSPGYADNPVRRSLFRAGHAHAGVLLVFALVGLAYLDEAALGDTARAIARTCLVLPPILMPLGFFLSVVKPAATKPNKLIWLVYAGAASLAVAVITVGIGLLRV